MPVPPDSTELVPLAGAPVSVRWHRSARARRVSLRIDPQAGGVVVTLPARSSRTAGLALLTAHADWVADRLARLPGATVLADGCSVNLGSQPHRIRHVPGGRGGAWLADGEIQVSGDPAFLPRRVVDLLRREAKRRLAPLVAGHAETLGVKPRRLTIKDTRSRWGSCAPDGTVMLCWRLVMAPEPVGDYVAAHEVAHLRHMNHGAAFWATVAELVPHRASATRWLQTEGPGLFRIG